MKFKEGDLVTVDTVKMRYFSNSDMEQAHRKSMQLKVVKPVSSDTYYCHSPHFKSGETRNEKELKTWLYREEALTLVIPSKEELLTLLKEGNITSQEFLDYQTNQKEEPHEISKG